MITATVGQHRFFPLLVTVTTTPVLNHYTSSARGPSSRAIVHDRGNLLRLSLATTVRRVSLTKEHTALVTCGNRIPKPELRIQTNSHVRVHFAGTLPSPAGLRCRKLRIPPAKLTSGPFQIITPNRAMSCSFALPASRPDNLF